MSIYNKITINGTTYMDLSQDTVADVSHIRQGYTGHLNNGTQVTGTYAGSTPTLITKSISANGTYNASSDNADGYSAVTVNVSSGGSSWSELADQDVTIVSDDPNYFLINNYTTPFAANQTYRVTWGNGGTQYICQTDVDGAGISYDGYFIGNAGTFGGTDTGEPFLLYRDRATRIVGVTNQSAGTIHIKIELQIGNLNLQEKTNISPTTSSQTIQADAGYDGLSSVQINAMLTMTLPTSTSSSATSGYTSKATIGRSTSNQYINIAPGYNSAGGYYTISAVPNGSASGPSSVSGTSATVSTGTNTLTLTKSVSITPTVSAGYVSSGNATNATVTLTASVTTKTAATIVPTTSN